MAVPPLLWMLADVIVVGEPLYSLTKTREVAGEFGRQRGIGAAIRLIPDYAAGNDKVVTVGVGGLGLLLALYLLRRRAALAVALGGLGVATFLAIAAAGLSVIPRYMTIPSILLSLCVAVALTGLDADLRAACARRRDRRRDPVGARDRLARARLPARLPRAQRPVAVRRAAEHGPPARADATRR